MNMTRTNATIIKIKEGKRTIFKTSLQELYSTLSKESKSLTELEFIENIGYGVTTLFRLLLLM